MAQYNELNPIRSINGTYVPVLAGYTFNASDVSDSDSGRTEDTKMHKNMLGTCAHIGMEWKLMSPSESVEIMQAFAPVYFTVVYLDVRTGSYSSGVFYAGDKTATMVMTSLGPRYNISFNIIERQAH